MGDANGAKGSIEKFASGSYIQVSGKKQQQPIGENEEEVGDGVVPLSAAHLPGALQITIANSYHSIQAPGNLWYGGADEIVDQWYPAVMQSIEDARKDKTKRPLFPKFW